MKGLFGQDINEKIDNDILMWFSDGEPVFLGDVFDSGAYLHWEEEEEDSPTKQE